MTEAPTKLYATVDAFVSHRSYGASRRGYYTDGHVFCLNGHVIAQWHDGAVRMVLDDPSWQKTLVAQAIPKVRRLCNRWGFLRGTHGPRACKEHADCRENDDLGKACLADKPVLPAAQKHYANRQPLRLPARAAEAR